MNLTSHLLWSLPLALAPLAEPVLPPTGSAGLESRPSAEQTIPWNARTVEHLFNRAGFGAPSSEISRALKRTPEQVVEKLLTGGKRLEPPYYVQGNVEDLEKLKSVDRREKRRLRAIRSRDDREQLAAYTSWWIDRMVEGDDPLRDRLTLFWHGLFATAHSTVKRSYDMIEQHQMIRARALESYGELLHGLVRDPAMLFYLDNHKNRKGKPNENLGRELLELFSLGEGNYTERDVKEVARALTGESRDQIGNYRYLPKFHDNGEKTILGETGRFGAPEVVEILLRQTACSRYISRRLLVYLEGVEPDDLRLTEYAAYLKQHEYELKPFLRKLFLDPRFYREEVMLARVSSPVDYLVGTVRRLSMKMDTEFIAIAAGELGQELFDPPSVKGWDGGEAWISTGSLLARGNTVGLMLGTVDLQKTFRPIKKTRDPLEPLKPGEGSMEEEARESETMERRAPAGERRDNVPREIAVLAKSLGKGYLPDVNLTYRLRRRKTGSDARLVRVMMDDLLAIRPPQKTHQRVLVYFEAERIAAGLEEESVLEDSERSEPLLRRLAHLILSLPEGQLN